jgi:serine/threonine-protein kinase
MPLTVGTRLGAYEVTGVLGAGGMGEVYRARDSKLGRAVAVKVVRDELGADPDRISRFEREAKMLAALNHPHIAALYGMDVADGRHFLVMELVEGETLADRLRRGPLPVDETLRIAQQITDALEAAHERGIVHRDLKPANVKITPDDKVKVLDFGLAKAMETERPGGSTADSPTLSMMASQAGIILGTAAYMSPEQAKGFPADHRSDVFSFGVVVYEMLTGRQPFQGDTAAEVLASVLVRDPELSRLPASLNPRLTDLIRRCLEKSAKRRWQAIGDVRAEIEAIAAMPAVMPTTALAFAPPRPLWRRAVPVVSAALVTGALAAAAAWSLKPAPPREVARLVIAQPEGAVTAGRNPLAISQDGQSIVFAAGRRLYLRSLPAFDVKLLPGTDALDTAVVPAFSPDGRSVAFYGIRDASIKRLDLAGGVAHTITASSVPFGMSWDQDGILTADGADGISRVSPHGGAKEKIIAVKDGETATTPQRLPGGQILFAIASGQNVDRWDKAQVVVQAPGSADRKVVINGGSDPHYVATGHIVYSVGGSLMAIAFDVRRLETRGSAVPVLDGVWRSAPGASGAANFAVSETGSLIYIPGPAGLTWNNSEVVLSDRKGSVEVLKLPAAAYSEPRASPDGLKIAVTLADKDTSIWIYDLAGTTAPRRLTHGGNNVHPVWSFDSKRVTFHSDREGDRGMFRQLADGSSGVERLTRADPGVYHEPESWSPTGDALLFTATKGNERSLWIYSEKTKTSQPFGGIRSANQISAGFSRDGAWVVYATNDSGRSFVYVQPYPPTGIRYQATAQPGSHTPIWSPDSKEILFNPRPSGFEAVSFTAKPAVEFGNPVAVPLTFLTGPPQNRRSYDMTRSGKILGLRTPGLNPAAAPLPILVVLNWFEELKQRFAR